MNLPITRADALARLDQFMPLAGSAYAKRRNYDYGPGAHDAVSRLSAALRRRSLTEEEVIGKILAAHNFSAAEKFIQEVFWRTYWKGWLEMRPSLWTSYRQSVASGFAQSAIYEQAMSGQTPVACFNAWLSELQQTNYLHNHARMWFASIWIHSFGLPWQAGADLFMYHLADGDPASNTLGWRWVAGLQTRGKAYGARADNIAQFTNGRFAPYGELQEDVSAIDGPENPQAAPPREPYFAEGSKALLLITPEDCMPETLPVGRSVVGIASLSADLARARSMGVMAADQAALNDACQRAERHFNISCYSDLNIEALRALMEEIGADHIVMAYQPVGYWHDFLIQHHLPIKEVRRPYDTLCWPHAKKGFFPFKEKIPSFIKSLSA